MNISKAFKRFPEEAALIGRLLAGYTDLEVDLMNCVKSARQDLDTVLKAMYRSRGETQRIDVADAFGRQEYRNLGLGADFEMAIGATRHCLRIRNIYSHFVWWDDNSGQMALANLEEIAKLNTPVQDLRGATVDHVSVDHLRSQFTFFEFTSDLLIWILQEGNRIARRPTIPNNPRPLHQNHPDIYLD